MLEVPASMLDTPAAGSRSLQAFPSAPASSAWSLDEDPDLRKGCDAFVQGVDALNDEVWRRFDTARGDPGVLLEGPDGYPGRASCEQIAQVLLEQAEVCTLGTIPLAGLDPGVVGQVVVRCDDGNTERMCEGGLTRGDASCDRDQHRRSAGRDPLLQKLRRTLQTLDDDR